MKDLVNETINLIQKQNLTEMARIGFTDDGFEVYVNTNDGGNKPHFHYRTKNDWKFHSCIRIDTLEYFEHEGKEGKLNSKQRKELVNFLNSISEDDESKTNWQVLIIEWNRNNSSKKVDKNLQMPNYLNLR